MRRTLCFRLAEFFSLILCLLPSIVVAQDPPQAEQVLARVNGSAIGTQDFAWEIGQLTAEMIRRNTPLTDSQLAVLRPQLLENLIERELLFQHARQLKMKALDKWVDAALADLKGQLERVGSLQTYLADSGMNQTQLNARLAKGVVVERLMRQETIRSIAVSEAEMQAFYRDHPELFNANETIRARHILIAPKDASDSAQAEALQKIQALQKRIEQGEDFAILALEYSDCPSRAYAGDIGYLTREEMVAPFADAAFALAPGAVSDVVLTRFGYHLIKLLERIPADPPNFWEARADIERILRRDKENAALRGYVAALKKQAAIERLGAPP
ncbi:MAG: peptidylprolyl isomerase [Desulfatitalea sp.]|nr:peptidylprolyl isomerase [Desulfatitalea sp.]